MDNIVIKKVWNPGKPVMVDDLTGNVFTGEDAAHTFEISSTIATSGISGTIAGKFLRADNLTVPVTGGSASDGVASITLNEQCYEVPGRFVLSVFANDGTHNICIYCGVGSVTRTNSSRTVDPGTIISDVTELINRINTAIASCPASHSAIQAAVAPNFVQATANPAGTYVWYDGSCYYLKDGHAAGAAWADTAKTDAVIGNDMADLKSAIPIEKSTILNTVQTGYVYNSFEWEVGYVNNSGVVRTDISRGLISPLMHNSAWNGYVIYNANPSKYDIIKYFYDPDTEEYIGKSTISSYPHTMPYTSERKTRLFVRDSATAGAVELTSAELMAMRAAVNVKSTIPYVIDIPQLTALDNYVSSEGVYPFTADSTLYRPGYSDQIVYSQELNGIIDLIVYANDLDTYYVQTLYAYHASAHESVITIANSAGRTGTYSAARSSSTDRPTETITINDTNGDLLAKAVIDWSRINKASGAGLTAVSTRIAEGCIVRTVNSDNIRALPITDYYVTNVQQRIYFDEIFRGYNGGYFVVTATGATYPEITYTDRYVQFVVTSTKDISVTIEYRNDDAVLISKTITVHCNISAVPAKKYMFIGDSYTEAGYMQNWFYDQNPGLVTLYGTRGTAPYLHEGRYGWRVQDYFHDDKPVANPFYNPTSQTFDFSYYMTNHPEFADVDVVNILLGRNNGFSTTIITQIQQIVTSIYSYNANIKIYVMVGSNVAANNTGAGRYMQSNEEMNLNCFNYNRVVSYENASIIWQNCNLDDVYDFATEQVQATLTNPTLVTMYTDNVHPSQYGYQAFGVVFNGYMHNLLNS